jgi:hypothetical protein
MEMGASVLIGIDDRVYSGYLFLFQEGEDAVVLVFFITNFNNRDYSYTLKYRITCCRGDPEDVKW